MSLGLDLTRPNDAVKAVLLEEAAWDTRPKLYADASLAWHSSLTSHRVTPQQLAHQAWGERERSESVWETCGQSVCEWESERVRERERLERFLLWRFETK